MKLSVNFDAVSSEVILCLRIFFSFEDLMILQVQTFLYKDLLLTLIKIFLKFLKLCEYFLECFDSESFKKRTRKHIKCGVKLWCYRKLLTFNITK